MYEVGDKVIIRKDLVNTQYYGSNDVASRMMKYRGRVATIVDVLNTFPSKEYLIDLDNQHFAWTPEMFEKGND